MKILIKYTSRSRPELFKRGLSSIINNVTGYQYHVLVTCDENDSTMNNLEMKTYLHSLPHVSVKYGVSKNKVDAINRDINEFLTMFDADIIVNMSDDMVFIQAGFDDIIRSSFRNGLDQVETDLCLHFPDGNRNDLITMSILGRKYYDRFNYIYHPEYKSLYCDNEQTDVSKILGCYRYVDRNILLHLHPAYGLATFDGQYQHTESFNNEDCITYNNRKQINFGL